MVATVMTANRVRIQISLEWIQKNAKLFGFVQAKDGIWLPACDLAQYEAGNRSWA